MSRMISFVVLIAIVLIFAALSFEVLSSFLLPIFLAVLLVVMFRPMHRWFLRICKGRTRFAAGMTTIAILLIALLPMLWILARAGTETVSLLRTLNQDQLLKRTAELREKLHLDLPPEQVQHNVTEIENALAMLQQGPVPPQVWSHEVDTGVRQNAIKRIESLTAEMERELTPAELAGGGDVNQAVPPDYGKLKTSFGELRHEIESLHKTESNQTEFNRSLDRAGEALAQFKDQLFGSPLVAWLKRQANLDKDQLAEVQARLKALAGPLALGTTQFVGSFLVELIVGLSILIVSLYYFLADGPAMLSALMRLSPLDDRYEEQLLNEFDTITRAVIVSMLLSAFVQGLLAGVGFFIAGFDSVFLLSVLTMLFAMVPFVGAAAVWGTASLWLFVHDGEPKAAIAMALYGTLVVSMADNVIKPMVLHGRSNLHPLLALLSVLGGAKAMGPIGIVVGPMIVAFLQTLLVMLRNEMLAMDVKGTTSAIPLPAPSDTGEAGVAGTGTKAISAQP
jgi:predicted PurR-regulated permease PerM